MATRYRIFAYSPSLNQKQQSMDLMNDTLLENQGYAQQVAQSFASRLNQNIFMHVTDWQADIEPYEHIDNHWGEIEKLG